MEHNRRHRFVWALLRPLARLLVWIKFGFRAENVKVDGPFMVLCNHVTDWDPILLGAAFENQMYFVASEHILRLGFVSRLLEFLVYPIARQKGGSAAGTVKAIMRTVKEGYNVAFFPEGNRTWDGLTRGFPASTAKLVRSCGCTLVTYRLTGGYFSSPRWAGARIRRGKMSGEVAGIYSPEELRAMKPEAINSLIIRDLAVDAYAAQREEMTAYKGKRLAEDLETLLFICPKCGAIHSLASRGDTLCCTACGMETRFTKTGFFEGGELPFDDVCSWSRWQDGELKSLIARAGEEPIFSDGDIELLDIETARGSNTLGCGSLELYRDRLVLPGGLSVMLADIGGMSLQGNLKLYLSTNDGRHFLLRPKSRCCTNKYLTACGMLGASVGYGV